MNMWLHVTAHPHFVQWNEHSFLFHSTASHQLKTEGSICACLTTSLSEVSHVESLDGKPEPGRYRNRRSLQDFLWRDTHRQVCYCPLMYFLNGILIVFNWVVVIYNSLPLLIQWSWGHCAAARKDIWEGQRCEGLHCPSSQRCLGSKPTCYHLMSELLGCHIHLNLASVLIDKPHNQGQKGVPHPQAWVLCSDVAVGGFFPDLSKQLAGTQLPKSQNV